MGYLIGLLCLFYISLLLKSGKKIYHPLILFNFWWGLNVLISNLGLFNIYIPETKTYLVILIGILAFNFPVVFFMNGKKLAVRNNKKKEEQVSSATEIQLTKFLTILQAMFIFVLIKRSLSVLQLLLTGLDYSRIRYEYYYGTSIMSGYDHLIQDLFIAPIITFSTIIISLQFFQRKYNRLLLITTILCIGLSVFSSGSRGLLLTSGLIVFFAFIINKNAIKISLSKRMKIQFLTMVVISFLIYITFARTGLDGGVNDILKTVVLYFTGPFIYFEYLMPYALQDSVTLYGGAFFGGILDIIIFILNLIGFDINSMASYISAFNQSYLNIGEGISYNAFPTMLYTFFYDFNYFGIIIGPMLFGFMAMISYRKMLVKDTYAYKGIYIMVAIMIYQSTMSWTGIGARPWIVIILFLILNYVSDRKIVFKLK